VLRSILSRLLALTCLMTPAFAALTGSPAQAAPGNSLSMEWQTVTYRAPVVSQTATFTTYTTGRHSGGAYAVMPGSFNGVYLAPPSGARFETGGTYSAAYYRDASRALLSFNNFAFSRTECTSASTAPYTGTITVHWADYDDAGALLALSADYSATCAPPTGASETVAGSVRFASAEPWLTIRRTSPKDFVPTGRERTTAVTLSGLGAGKTVELGSATISGVRAADYRIVTDGCSGTTMAPDATCTIGVTFAPLPSSSAETDRVARLSLPVAGHVLTSVEVGLESRALPTPGAPPLKLFPTASGLGVMWAPRSDGDSDSFRLERRLADSDTWTTLQEGPATAPRRYVDQDLAPGASATYRVTGALQGWDGTPSTVSGIRPATVPPVGDSSTVSYGDDDARTTWNTITSETASGFNVYGGLAPSLVADGPSASGTGVSWKLPLVTGPGTYTAPEVAGPAYLSGTGCTDAERVLEVRSVLYDETAKPVVLDGSWVERCSRTAPTRRMEVRIGLDAVGGRVTTPTVVGPLNAFGDQVATTQIQLGNGGTGAITFGTPRIDGAGADDWSVQASTCTAAVDADGTCRLTIRFATTTEGPRPAMLTIPRSDSVGPLAPAYVPLEGSGGTEPDAVPQGWALGTVDAVIVWWDAANGHGLEVDDYFVERQRVGTTTWESLGRTLGARRYVDRDASEGASFRYRVSARNVTGYGPTAVVGDPASADADRALVVAGSIYTGGRTGLYQVAPGRPDAPPVPLITDTRDYFSPAVSPAGSRLAFARSTTDGSDGQYNLWSGTPAAPVGKQLTSLAGLEFEPAYSPDATRIAFTHLDMTGHTSVWVVDAVGGTPRKLRADASAPVWATDGRSMIAQDDSSESAPLLTIAVDSGVAEPVSGTDGGIEPAVSRTGRLAWIDVHGQVLTRDPGETTPTVAVPAPTDTFLTSLVYDDRGTLLYDEIDPKTAESITHRSDHLAYTAEAAPLRSDRTTPELAVGPLDAYVHGSASLTLSASDHGETPESALRPQCSLDDVALTCGATVSLTKLTEGAHTLAVQVADESGHATTVERPFVSDTVAPKGALTAPTQVNVNKGVAAFSWSGTDASGIAGYEVRSSTSTPYAAAKAYAVPAGLPSTTTARSLTLRPALGQTVCLRVRSLDRSGLWSAYTTRCVSRPLDDRSLRASAGWTRTSLASALQRTVTGASRANATLSTTSTATVRRISVLGVSCSACGSVRVYVGDRYVGAASFRGANAVRQVNLPVLAAPLRGVVSLRTTSRSAVKIDGLLLSQS
jgi:hypothetical protein